MKSGLDPQNLQDRKSDIDLCKAKDTVHEKTTAVIRLPMATDIAICYYSGVDKPPHCTVKFDLVWSPL